MNPTTLQALQDSIAHWTRLSEGKRLLGECAGPRDCALCREFNTVYNRINDPKTSCLECPVYLNTGEQFCCSSPYPDAEEAEAKYGLDSPEFQSAAREELEFLKSLLPDTNENPTPTNPL